MERFEPIPRSERHPYIVAHRGISGKCPENTFAAFEMALGLPGIDLIELDVRLSRDEEVIVLHDRTLQRTTTGNGPARKCYLSELKEHDAGSWFEPRFSNERIPSLNEILEISKGRLFVNIEMKSDLFHKEPDGLLEKKVLDTVRSNNMVDQVLISSFNHRLVSNIKKLEPRLRTGVIYSLYRDFFYSPARLAEDANADVFVCAKHELRKWMIHDMHVQGKAIYVYTLNAVTDVFRIARLGVDAILSDNADEIVPLLRK